MLSNQKQIIARQPAVNLLFYTYIICIIEVMKPYQCDPNKAKSNLKKHGVSFDEAYTALLDERALVMSDPDCEDEERFVLLRLSDKGRLLTVIYTMRGNTPRLISARKSTDREKKHYA